MNTAANASDQIYDFESEENSSKWKGVLIAALKRVLEQVHPSLDAREDALDYVESLCLRLLAMLCAKPSPHTVQDVEYRVQSTFPTPIDKWALKEAQEALERGKKKSVLPVDKIHNLLQKELLLYKVDSAVSLFLVAVLEYISADILKLAGNYVKHIKHVEITFQDVQISMNADKALMDMFYQDEGGGPNMLTDPPVVPTQAPRTSITYEEVVRELMASERQYLRELHMLIKVFREELIKLNADQKELDAIFSNILDIYELTVTLLGSLEDVMEMAQEQMLYIGSCFEELAEAAEFDVYSKYARDVTSPTCRDTLNHLLSRPQVNSALVTAGHGMPLALKYYLPALLTGPIRHCFSYLEFIKVLRGLSESAEDRETLTQVEGLLTPLQLELGYCVSLQTLQRSVVSYGTRSRRQAAMDKIHELQRIVENWDSKDTGQCCNEFIREDILMKVSSGKRLTERRVFLFDGLMILCKPNSRRQSSVHQTHPECRIKERFFIRKVEIVDHADTEEMKNAFEISPRIQPAVTLCTKNSEEKNTWMADLVMLNTRSMLDRILDSILTNMERKHPLRLPAPELYKFAEPDCKDNIVLEQRENGGVPLIKGATLYKLVERLTYHIYADPKFVRTFLTTYRSFCAPSELLDLLIERFNIPDPSLVYEVDCDTDKMQKNSQREDWKRYRKEYCQPVQFRVLNVLRHWVDHHFYDFERDPTLLEKLHAFLESVTGKSMRKWVDSVLKILQRKTEPDSQRHIKIAFDEPPPPIEWHHAVTEEDYGILTLHPVEIARQLTLLEFEIYRTIKPSELVGSVWTKKDKEITSPNLLRMMKHTTIVTRWLEKNIVEAENFEERNAILSRIVEIMTVLQELNNFNAVLAFVSALGSASVHRLKFTFNSLPQNQKKILEEWRTDDHLKRYQEKLRSINPPCVPFLGMYLTNILHLEEGNPDFLPNTQLINFFKRRKVADITGEIQQYQNQPYCYKVETKIKQFLENLNPFGDMSDTDISNYLYSQSIVIEPRGCKQVPKFPRKWPGLSLRSPGTKTKSPRQTSAGTMTTTQTKPEATKEEIANCEDNSVFAIVQIPGGQNSPTQSPPSPAPQPLTTPTPLIHSRTPSVSCPQKPMPQTGSPGPHSPASPGPFAEVSPRLSSTLPSTPPPLPPRRRRDSIEIGSPQQIKPLLPPRDGSPPPLPPRREPGPSPNAHLNSVPSSLPPPTLAGSLPRLNPTHFSQLHIRRRTTLNPHLPPRSVTHTNGSNSQPPSISPRSTNDTSSSGQTTPKLPPKPAVKSAGLTSGTMFQYPSTSNTHFCNLDTFVMGGSSPTKTSDDLEFHGYKLNIVKTVATYFFYLTSVGLLRLLFHWYPTWRLYATHSKCNLKIAEKLLIVDHYQGLFKSYFVEEVRRVTSSRTGRALTVHLEDGSVKNAEELTVVCCKKIWYVWDDEVEQFLRLSGLDKGYRCCDFYSFDGFSKEEQELRLTTYGKNDIDVPVNTIWALLCSEILTPFYFFQLFSIIVWFLDHYYYYTIAIIVMSLSGITTSIIQTRKNQQSLRKTVHSAESISVKRGGVFEETSSYDLVPGDVIVVPKNGCVMQCDAVLISGTCIVNESMLTGESVPVPKTPIPKTQTFYNIKDDSFHTLFCGTKVIQTRNPNDDKVLAVVLRTGFSTSKGELVRSILYPTPSDFKFDQDSYKVIAILTVVAFLGATYTVVSKSTRSVKVSYIILKALDLITIVIPPALPAAITVGKLYALGRLKRQNIFCINSRVISVSGTIDCMCFDKTGTLTEDGLDMWGVVPVHEQKFLEPVKDVLCLPDNSALFLGMASCHSLTIINDELVGDPLDVKMFDATGCSLEDGYHSRLVRRSNCDLEVLRQFPFSSNLQRMSVVVKGSNGLTLFCKGSPEMISSLSLHETVPISLSITLLAFTRKGYRVIAIASKNLEGTALEDVEKLERSAVESDLSFVGLVVLENRVKAATSGVIRSLKDADIKTIMITGDNMETALSVAKDCGIVSSDEVVATVSANHNYLTFSLDELTKESRTSEAIVPINPPSHVYAMTGATWSAIKQNFPERLDEFVRNGVVFARMSGQQKQDLIQELKKQGYYTGMCGDGANDCGALKASHVGISLSEEESSVASPFTSKTPDISCVPQIIREGRAALATCTGIFKFMICYSLTQFTSAIVLYGIDDNLASLQFLFVDIFIVLNIMSTFGNTKAYDGPLHKDRPLDSLLSLTTVTSILFQLIFVVFFQVAAYHLVQTFEWFVPFVFNPDDPYFLTSYENYAVYMSSLFQYLIMLVVLSKGKPFRKPIYTNVIFFGDILVLTGVCLYILFYPAQWVITILELKVPPGYNFNLLLLGLAVMNFACSLISEDVIVGFFLTKKLHPKLYELLNRKKYPKEDLSNSERNYQITKM
ncbi:hypothetical protein FQR65_LT00129 [Abscondita terminalis]|nr:hypothetical protein FQR65_LT00129 [Abscondita terminalis]